MRFGLFTSIVTGLVSLGHIYVYLRLFRDTGAPSWARRLGLAALVALGPGFIVLRQLFWPLPWPWSGTVTAAQWLWLISAGYLVGVLVLADLALLVRRRAAGRPAAGHSEERRRVLAAATAGAASVVTASLVGYGGWRAYGAPPVINEVPVRLPHWPRALSGFTIVQLSDLHVGSLIGDRFIRDLVERVNALKPDLVAITGDLGDGPVEHLGQAIASLSRLRARSGTFFVTGNHEYHSDDLGWCAALEGLGLQVLRNRAVRIGEAEDSFDLVGVDDWSGGRRRGGRGYDLGRALAGLRPERARVLLAHQPANFSVAVKHGVGLQLSGHTHGGQVFPMTELVRLQWEHVAGLYPDGASHIFVSRGTGFWGPPLRIGSPPEIARLVLTA